MVHMLFVFAITVLAEFHDNNIARMHAHNGPVAPLLDATKTRLVDATETAASGLNKEDFDNTDKTIKVVTGPHGEINAKPAASSPSLIEKEFHTTLAAKQAELKQWKAKAEQLDEENKRQAAEIKLLQTRIREYVKNIDNGESLSDIRVVSTSLEQSEDGSKTYMDSSKVLETPDPEAVAEILCNNWNTWKLRDGRNKAAYKEQMGVNAPELDSIWKRKYDLANYVVFLLRKVGHGATLETVIAAAKSMCGAVGTHFSKTYLGPLITPENLLAWIEQCDVTCKTDCANCNMGNFKTKDIESTDDEFITKCGELCQCSEDPCIKLNCQAADNLNSIEACKGRI